MAAALALWAVPLVVVVYLLRTVAVLALRGRYPKAAEGIDRWWAWVPFAIVLAALVVVLVLVTINAPVLGVVLTAAAVVGIYFALFSATSTGSPFRPRRR